MASLIISSPHEGPIDDCCWQTKSHSALQWVGLRLCCVLLAFHHKRWYKTFWEVSQKRRTLVDLWQKPIHERVDWLRGQSSNSWICYTFVLLAVYQLLVTLVIAWVTKPKFQRNEGPNGPGIGSRGAWTSGCLTLIIELSGTISEKSLDRRYKMKR